MDNQTYTSSTGGGTELSMVNYETATKDSTTRGRIAAKFKSTWTLIVGVVAVLIILVIGVVIIGIMLDKVITISDSVNNGDVCFIRDTSGQDGEGPKSYSSESNAQQPYVNRQEPCKAQCLTTYENIIAGNDIRSSVTIRKIWESTVLRISWTSDITTSNINSQPNDCTKHWEVMVNNAPCVSHSIDKYSRIQDRYATRTQETALFLGHCSSVPAGDVIVEFHETPCPMDRDAIPSPDLYDRASSYIISEINIGMNAAGCPCADESVFNIVPYTASDETTLTLPGPGRVAGLTYAKALADTAIKVLITTTASTRNQCYRFFVTFNGYKCDPGVEGTFRNDDTTVAKSWDRSFAMFGICSGLDAGDVIIDHNVESCDPLSRSADLNMGLDTGIQFEVSEIRLAYVPQSIGPKVMIYNVQHYTFPGTQETYTDRGNYFIVNYNKRLEVSRLHILFGMSIGGVKNRAQSANKFYWSVMVDGQACVVPTDIVATVELLVGSVVSPVVLEGTCVIRKTGDTQIYILGRPNTDGYGLGSYTGYRATTHVTISEINI